MGSVTNALIPLQSASKSDLHQTYLDSHRHVKASNEARKSLVTLRNLGSIHYDNKDFHKNESALKMQHPHWQSSG